MGKKENQEDVNSLEMVSRAHPLCPDCGLPTFKEDEGTFFCASCQGVFDERKKALKPHVHREEGRSHMIPIVISATIVIIFIIAALGITMYKKNNDDELIDIHDIEGIRGLEAEKEVPVNYMDPGLYDDHIQSALDDERRREIWELERFYECMLVMDPSWDLISLVENSSSANVLAFYDTDSEEITIIEGSRSDVYLNYVLSHELTHALQDQNFDLDSYYPTGSFDTDAARLCAVEGDAMFTMEMWAEENLGLYDRIKLGQDLVMQTFRSDAYYDLEYSNEIISEMEYFPYLDGMEFVERVYRRSGFEGVNELFTEYPPESTEQILHFEKYLDRESPETIDLPLGLIDMDVSFESSAGEKLLTELVPGLKDDIVDLERNETDLGWGGDRFVYLENGSSFLSLFAIQWDTEKINDIFFLNFEDMMFWEGNGMIGGSTVMDGNHMKVLRDGRRTYVLSSNDPLMIEETSGLLVQ